MENVNIDFQVYDSGDPKQLIVLDTSIWGIIQDRPAIIEIIPPGFKEPSVNYFKQNFVNIFTSHTLGLNCESNSTPVVQSDLPDGVYEITLKGSPDKFNKKRLYLKTTSLNRALDDVLISKYSECIDCIAQDDDISKVLRYKNLIEVAEAFVRKGLKREAQNIIFKIQDYAKDQKNCKGCRHSR